MKSILLPLLGTALFIVAVGFLLNKTPNINLKSEETKQVSTARIGDKDIILRIVKTNEERQKGLSGVTSLEKDSGMLFVFDKTDKPQFFWMKDMLISIDIIWIKDGKIVRIDKSVPFPEPQTSDEGLIRYSAGIPVDYVLEVSAGYSDANSFKVGDEVTFSGI